MQELPRLVSGCFSAHLLIILELKKYKVNNYHHMDAFFLNFLWPRAHHMTE